MSINKQNQDGLELSFKECFKSNKWQNAILFAVLKTHERIPHVEDANSNVIRDELESSRQQTNEIQCSNSIPMQRCDEHDTLTELVQQYCFENDIEQPSLVSMLYYIIHNKIIVRKNPTERRSAICEDSMLDRDIIYLILKKYRLEETLLKYSLE